MIVEYLSSTTKNTALNPKSFAEKSENMKDHVNRKIKNMIVLYGDVGTPTVRNEVPGRTTITRNIACQSLEKTRK